MYRFDVEPSGRKMHPDHLLIACVLFLTGIGLMTLYSASYAYADRFMGDGLHFISRQLIFAALGFAAFLAAMYINLDILRKWIMPLVLGTFLLCALTFIPGIGVVKNGAARWIRVGPFGTYQPSEMVKLVLPVYLAHIFDKKQDRMDSIASSALPPTLITAIFFLLIYRQNNFSTAVFIAMNALIIFFLAGVKLRFFFYSILVLVPISAILILTKEHRVWRIMSFIWPDWDPLGAGYQVRSSILTVASGGILGQGIGQGSRKIASVPEVHSDFVFSAYAEEAGLIGVTVFFLLIVFFALRSYRAALRREDNFRRLLACGLTTMIVSQALLNVAVVIGALPATGIPLPFFSAGGSSLAATLVMAGLIVNVSRNDRATEVKNV